MLALSTTVEILSKFETCRHTESIKESTTVEILSKFETGKASGIEFDLQQ